MIFVTVTAHWVEATEVEKITGARVYENRIVYKNEVAKYLHDEAVVYAGDTFPLQKLKKGKKLFVRADQMAPILFQMGGKWFWDAESNKFFKGESNIFFLMGKVGDKYVINVVSGGKKEVIKSEDSVVVDVDGLYGKFWRVLGDGDFVASVLIRQFRKKTRFIIYLGPRAGEYSSLSIGDSLRIYISKLEPQKASRVTIVLDPGHGGRDVGAVGNGYKEKDINLNVALKVAKILRMKGYKVLLTREKDEYVSLYARARMANRSGAHIFVSIHCNAGDDNARGMETYFLSESRTSQERAVALLENSVIKYDIGYVKDYEPVGAIIGDMIQNLLLERSYELALSIQRAALHMALAEDRGVKQAGFYVLKWVMMPSVLVELGFISNEKEAKKLASESYQRKLAKAIALGIEEYIKKTRR